MSSPRILLPALAFTVFAGELPGRTPKQMPDADDPVVVLKPLVVRDKPVTSFGIALQIEADPRTQLITSIVVIDVPSGSDAWSRNIQKGTRILAIEDRDVRTIAARFDPGSDFNRFLMNRRDGDRIKLTVVPGAGGQPRVVELTQRYRTDRPAWPLSDFP